MKSRVMLLIAAGLMCLSGLTHAYAVTVNNASFESPALAGSGGIGPYNSSFVDWAGSDGIFGTWKPNDRFDTIPQGAQVAYIYSGSGLIAQTTAEILKAGYTYTLSAQVGWRDPTADEPFEFGGGKIELLAGATVLKSATVCAFGCDFGAPLARKWATVSLDFTADGNTPGLDDPLTIRLSKLTTAATHHTSFDTISLTAVPLPAAAWLFGSALLGLGWARRSRLQQQEVLCA